MNIKKRTKVWLAAALILCLISAIGVSFVQSNFGSTSVSTYSMTLTEIADAIRANNAAYGKNVEISFTESETAKMQFKLLVPKNATQENPVPAIVTCHGSLNNKEMQNINYVGWARRGFVVISMDGAGHDGTDFEVEGLTHNSHGMETIAEYIMSLPYVDQTQVAGIVGVTRGVL